MTKLLSALYTKKPIAEQEASKKYYLRHIFVPLIEVGLPFINYIFSCVDHCEQTNEHSW